MQRDIYQEVRALIRELETVGFSVWAQKLQEAMESGSTSGEILMAVRSVLRELRKANVHLVDHLEKAVDLLIRDIDRTGV